MAGCEDCYSRAPSALPGLVNLRMAAIVDNEKGVGRLVVFNHRTNLEHELEVGVLGRDTKNVGLVMVIIMQDLLQVLQLWQDKEIVGLPVQK
jgi:hypothetical protein